MTDDALFTLFTTPQIHTDEAGHHYDQDGREYVRVVIGGEATFVPVAQDTPHTTLRHDEAGRYLPRPRPHTVS